MLKPKLLKPVAREMFRGDTLTIDLVITDPKTGSPLNLTGCKIWFTCKGNVALPDNQSTIALDTVLVSGNGSVTITDAPRGLATVVVYPIATRALPDGPVVLQYDIQIKQGTGELSTIEFGTVTVFPDVTRAIA